MLKKVYFMNIYSIFLYNLPLDMGFNNLQTNANTNTNQAQQNKVQQY